jgi:[ribosomal protein S18]-alanine N-acetyltransferase
LPIRTATLADAPALIALEQSAPTAAHWSPEHYHAALSPTQSERLALITEEGTQTLGFLIAREIGNEWEIENVVVSAPIRRKGLASQLLEEFLHRARLRSAKTVFLEVRESNLPARRLYEKHGFAECGCRERYYRGPQEDAIVYRTTLS